MKEDASQKKRKNPLVYVGVGCLILLILAGVGLSVAFKFFSKQISTAMVESAIESKTGVQTNLEDLENGKMTFTDEKTGAKVTVGSDEIPDTFPKDFPIYPNAKVTSSLSGAQGGQSNGMWVTLSTADTTESVTAFYKSGLADNGWKVETTFSASGMTTQSIVKGTMKGTLTIGKSSSDAETQIAIMLGQEE